MSIIKRTFLYVMIEDVMHDVHDADTKDKFKVFFQSLLCILVGTFDYSIAVKLDYIYHRGAFYQDECLTGRSKYVVLLTLVILVFLICAVMSTGIAFLSCYLLNTL